MDPAILIAGIGTLIAIAALAWQIVIFVQGRRTRISLRVNPVVSPDKKSWTITGTVINRSHNPVYIRRVHLVHSRYPTWYVDLRPRNDEEAPLKMEPGSEITYVADGDDAISTLGELNECICVATTSHERTFTSLLRSKDNKFETMCLVASLMVDDGSGSPAKFPWSVDDVISKTGARLLHWKLNFMVAQGWVEVRIESDGEEHYYPTAEGDRIAATGVLAPGVDIDGIFGGSGESHNRGRWEQIRLNRRAKRTTRAIMRDLTRKKKQQK
ncbi:hypothetical protein [Actinophytocola sp.]|uniref:hypothetical protein n=1 Tax=Actinophytocola sp. TaxID=1872138 RepID=UPI003D6A7478